MTNQEVSERFRSGAVQFVIATHKGVQWIGRIIGIIVCVCLIRLAPPDISQRVIYYALVVVLLWWMHGLGTTLAFVCEKGLVLKQRPTTLRDYFRSFAYHDEYYLYIPFDKIVGFTEGWKELQAVDSDGGIFIMPLDLQLAPYKDKMRMQQALKDYRESRGE